MPGSDGNDGTCDVCWVRGKQRPEEGNREKIGLLVCSCVGEELMKLGTFCEGFPISSLPQCMFCLKY